MRCGLPRRLSSDIFPWCTEYELKQLKDFDAIADELAFAGKLANAYDQRLTFHPSHFVKLAAETDELLNKSIKELEVHSLVSAHCVPCFNGYGDTSHTLGAVEGVLSASPLGKLRCGSICMLLRCCLFSECMPRLDVCGDVRF